MSHIGLSDLLRVLSRRPEGFGSADAELQGYTAAAVGTAARRMIMQGEMFRCRISAKNARFFDDATRAAAYGDEKRKALEARANAKSVAVANLQAIRAPAGWAEIEGQVTENTVRTYGPNYTPRFQAVEFGHIYSGCQRGRVLSQP
jgi:hypothetical protein